MPRNERWGRKEERKKRRRERDCSFVSLGAICGKKGKSLVRDQAREPGEGDFVCTCICF